MWVAHARAVRRPPSRTRIEGEIIVSTQSKRTRAASRMIAAVTATAAASSALAADLGRPYAPPPRDTGLPGRPLLIERWTGFYFGAGIGYGFGSTGVDGAAGAFSFDTTGAIGMLFAGYNWQVGSAVFGLEADIGTGNLGGSAAGAQGQIVQDVNAHGSLRARIGVIAMPNLLIYGTGGFAWADTSFRVSGGAEQSQTYTGYQLGLGTELLIAPQWTLRLEYIYTDLGKDMLTSGGIANNFDPDFHTVRAGIAFKF